MNNEVLQNIRTRRSCRAYTAQPVEPEKLKAIVEAGTWAASGMGRQAPKIVVLTDPAEIAELERMNAAVLGNPAAHPFYGAPVVCVVLTDPEVSTCVEDGALVIGNLMLAAHSLGVASCWIHRARQPGGQGPPEKVGRGRALYRRRPLHPRLCRERGSCAEAAEEGLCDQQIRRIPI